MIFALAGDSRTVEDTTVAAVAALKAHASRIIVTVPAQVRDAEARLAHLDVALHPVSEDRFVPAHYGEAMDGLESVHGEIDEIVLTGDGWFGPLDPFGAMIERMDAVTCDGWQAAEITGAPDEGFTAQGRTAPVMPWAWFVARRSLFESGSWRAFWSDRRRTHHDEGLERVLARELDDAGQRIDFAFPADAYPTPNAPTHVPDLLMRDGYPFLDRGVFGWFPSYLDRHGIVGSDILAVAEQHGLDRDLVLSSLARTVPPRTLNASGGLLEILSQRSVAPGVDIGALRVVAVVYARDLPAFENLCTSLANLPEGYDLVVTTTDGRKAARIERFVESHDLGNARLDVRVTPSRKGRDMADFFVGCHDVLFEGRYDVVVKVHARKHTKKTLNAVRYFTRYQTENLLGSPEYVQNVLGQFVANPHLGVVFPPMMHIGFSIIGSGWGGGRYRILASKLLKRLDVSVPLESVSPLAPYGTMWIGRPEALRRLAESRPRYQDYSSTGSLKDLARVQERVVAHAAAADGYYAKTVLTTEHASISHTALDFKVDQMFSTLSGHPVGAIDLVQRAGRMSGHGLFGLSRMYLNLNHPVLAAIANPAYRAAHLAIRAMRFGRRGLRYLRRRHRSYQGGL